MGKAHPEQFTFNLDLIEGGGLDNGALILDYWYTIQGFEGQSQAISHVDVQSGVGSVTINLPDTILSRRTTLAGTTADHDVVLGFDAANEAGIQSIRDASDWDALFGENGFYIGGGLPIAESDLRETLLARSAEAILGTQYAALFNAPFTPIAPGQTNVRLRFFGFSGPEDLGVGLAEDLTPVPEPATATCLASGAVVGGLVILARRRRAFVA